MASQFCSVRNFSIVLLLSLLLNIVYRCNGGATSSYRRKLYTPSLVDMPHDSFPPPPGYNAPEQVHITQGDSEGRAVIISWVNPKQKLPNHVTYWSADEGKAHKHARTAVTKTYKYYDYSSPFIHHATISNLEFDTKYFYEIGEGKSARQFSFATPPKPGADVPYTFGIIGDLGQTIFSNQTFEHYCANNKSKAVLMVGDLSYADDHKNHDNRRWDVWGRFVEKSTAYQPWIWTAGNHEIDFEPSIGETKPFKPYMNRYQVPYKSSGSTSPLWYSIRRGPAYIIVLSSYSATAKYTPQYKWLNDEWGKINRTETPWLIVLVHSPWYNSNNYHFMEGENMRVVFEQWLVDNKVDLVFAGHVHSYERSYRVSNTRYKISDGMTNPVKDPSAPVYITVGDGGNMEGLANNFTKPQPCYAAYREASFGHAILDIKNRTHAYFVWHRNEDGNSVNADSAWFYNRYWYEYPEEGDDDSDCN